MLEEFPAQQTPDLTDRTSSTAISSRQELPVGLWMMATSFARCDRLGWIPPGHLWGNNSSSLPKIIATRQRTSLQNVAYERKSPYFREIQVNEIWYFAQMMWLFRSILALPLCRAGKLSSLAVAMMSRSLLNVASMVPSAFLGHRGRSWLIVRLHLSGCVFFFPQGIFQYAVPKGPSFDFPKAHI